MASSSKRENIEFDGRGDVKVFLTKVELVAAIKGHTDETKAQFVASKLSGPAFDVYMRLSEDDRKEYDTIKEELTKEFEKGQLNRDEAIHLLSDRRRKPDESPQTFAYKILELVKLSYPTFEDGARKTVAKDYYMRGVHPEMQVALKSGAAFATSDVNALATETVRLELAGIKSYGNKRNTSETQSSTHVGEIATQNDTLISAITARVLESLQLNAPTDVNSVGLSDDNDVAENTQVNQLNDPNMHRFDGGFSNSYRGRGNRGRGRSNRARGGYRGGQRGGTRRCRGCQSTEHIVRNCPTRFCQACGNRGHDQSSELCPNYQC